MAKSSISFFAAASAGMFSVIPDVERRNPANYRVLDPSGNNPHHYAATNGSLDQIPEELLTEEFLFKPNSNGDTPIHHAALHGHLNQVPDHLFAKGLLLENNRGVAPLDHLLAQTRNTLSKKTKRLPDGVFNKEILFTNRDGTLFVNLFKCGHEFWRRIPKHLLTEDTLALKDPNGKPCIWWVANHQEIHLLPKETVTERLLLAKTAGDETIYHILCGNGTIDRVPPESITIKGLIKKDSRGNNAIHCAAARGHLRKIPKHLLEAEIPEQVYGKPQPGTAINPILIKNRRGDTAIHIAAQSEKLGQIPTEYITEEALRTTNLQGDSAYRVAANRFHLHEVPNDLILLCNAEEPDVRAHTKDLIKTSPGMVAMLHPSPTGASLAIALSQKMGPAETLARSLLTFEEAETQPLEPHRYAAVIRRFNPIAAKTGIFRAQALGHILTQICAIRDEPTKLGDLEVFLERVAKDPEAYCHAAKILDQTVTYINENGKCFPLETKTLWLLTQVAENTKKPTGERDPNLEDPAHVIDFFISRPNYPITLNTSWRRVEADVRRWEFELERGQADEWFNQNPEASWDERFWHPNYQKAPTAFTNNGVSYRLLQCPRDLLNEAGVMHHCVASAYLRKAFDGYSLLYHTEANGVPGTIEINPKGGVVQVQGIRNSKLPYENQVQETWNQIKEGFDFEPAVKRLHQGGEITDLEWAQATWHSRSNASAAELLQTFEAQKGLTKTRQPEKKSLSV